MIQTLKNAWKVPELKSKILFTMFALLVFRLGSAISVPFVDVEAMAAVSTKGTGTAEPRRKISSAKTVKRILLLSSGTFQAFFSV